MDGQQDGAGDALSRRAFVGLTVAAGIAGGVASATEASARPLYGGNAAATREGAATAPGPVREAEVAVATPDGRCDAFFCHPAEGRHPGVVLWPDALGLREAKRAMARRLAAAGYAVLVPNPYYRSAPAPLFDSAHFSFRDPADRARLKPLMATLSAAGVVEREFVALAAFLDAQAAVDAARRLGVHGYCMGGRLSFRSAQALPGRVGAVGSFHGGGLVTDGPDSPHRGVGATRARYYVGISGDDDAAEPLAKDALRAAFAEAGLAAEVELYPDALHGWCVPDMPARDGVAVYAHEPAEAAWAKLLALYATL